MGFSDFIGNRQTVVRLREMLARDRFPHAVILSGPQGAGKYTLALMLARAMNCLGTSGDRVIGRPTPQPAKAGPPGGPGRSGDGSTGQTWAVQTEGLPDYCGVCSNCRRIGEAADLEARCAEAVEAREGLRETDKRETRILVQPHPDVLIIPPDPPQMLVKVDQVRHVNETIRYKPVEGRRRVFIFSDSAFMKEAANALLKVLEEPPEYATLFLLARNPGELLATIRSRCVSFSLPALPAQQIEEYLANARPDWNARQRQLVARLSGGAIGRAKSLDLEEYVAARKDALTLLSTAVRAGDHSELFRTTETYRAGGEGKEKTDRLLSVTYGLLQDMMAVISGAPELVRNTDVIGELRSLSEGMDLKWIARAAQQLGVVQSGMRRNVLRPLSLDAFTLALER
jgi:DNA polymerase III subunit delta'